MPAFFFGGKAHSGRSEGNPTQAPTPAAPEGGAWNGSASFESRYISKKNLLSRKNNDRALDSGAAVCYTISVDGIREYIKPTQSHSAEHLTVPPRWVGRQRIVARFGRGDGFFFTPNS